jgi:N6-L-threonylcarbamoyladenine synthase
LEEGFGNPKSQISNHKQTPMEQTVNLEKIFEKERDLLEQFLEVIPKIDLPHIDAIAVTEGPGLEPCLWTGINLAKALSLGWNIPVIPVNHMEGHIFSALLRRKNVKTFNFELLTFNLPAIALLISGGHTELVLIKAPFTYEIIGQTKDDAVGEAFDKVARLLGLPYPGGPQISALAEEARKSEVESSELKVASSETNNSKLKTVNLPRPMLHSKDYNFSFSGLKTAVLYLLKTIPEITDDTKKEVALEFENAVTEVLVSKTKAAIEQCGAKSLLIGGGVIANTHIRGAFEDLAHTYDRKYLLNGEFLHIPEKNLTTDNALMIAVAGLVHVSNRRKDELKARGNLRLA